MKWILPISFLVGFVVCVYFFWTTFEDAPLFSRDPASGWIVTKRWICIILGVICSGGVFLSFGTPGSGIVDEMTQEMENASERLQDQE